MEQLQIKNAWGIRSISYWMTLLVVVGIIFIGVKFILNPMVGADGYGIPISEAGDLSYGRIKGIRDIFSGVVLLPFLFAEMRKATWFALTTAIMVPASDFCIILTTNGPTDVQHLLIHGLTAVYMIVTSILLFRAK